MNGHYETIRAALSYIPAQDRDIWVRMGMAVKSELGEDGFALWEAWSRTADNYNARDARDVWKSIKSNGEISIATLFYEAKGHGWRASHPLQGPSPEELEQRRTQCEAEEHKRQAEEARKHELARKRAKAIWEGASFAPDDHPYLVRKGVKSHGLKLYRGKLVIDGMLCDGALLVPVRDSEGVLHSLEFISLEGEKRFLPGGKKTGCFFLIGTPGAVLGIAEGYATAASPHEATSDAVTVAFDCGNLPVVAKALGEKYPDSSLIICGDRGQGEAQAREAARAVNARLALPDFSGLHATEKDKDFNDLHRLAGLEAVKAQFRQAKTLIEEAKSVIEALDVKDPGGWFGDKALEALALLHAEAKPDYERAIARARKVKADIKDLKREVEKRARKLKNSNAGKQTHETHLDMAGALTAQGFQANLPTHPQTHIGHAKGGVILVRPGYLPEAVDEAERLLIRKETDFYQRGGQLVRTCVKRVETVRGIRRPEGAVTIIPIDIEYLLDRLNRSIEWKREKPVGDDIVAVTYDAPRKVATTLLARRGHWLARPLTGVINAPTLRPDGSLLDKPGYDAATGLLFVNSGGAEFLPIAERPSRSDALAVLAELKDVIKDFPFAKEYDRSAALSAMLMAIIRHSLRTVPMHTFSAPKMSSGKSLLADVVSFIATGSPATAMSYTEDDNEMRKRIISILVQGDLVINVDNIETPFGSQTLCTVLTQEEFTDRLLGTNRLVTAPTTCCWLATGNNLLIKGDLITRVIPCELDPECENPEQREFDRNLYEWLPKERSRLVRAALTVLRAYCVAGKPKQDIKNFARFEDWSSWVRAALVWLGEPDPCLGREKLIENDPVSQVLRNLLIAWHGVYRSTPTTTKQAIADANKTILGLEGNIHYEHEPLYDALLSVCGGRDGKLNGRRLGNYLERYERRVEAGARFERRGSQDRYICWRVNVLDQDSFRDEFGG